MRTTLFCGLAVAALAQNPEAGIILRHESTATLKIDSPRPLDSAAITLADNYQLHVNAEDAPYLYDDDVRDVTAAVARAARPWLKALIPKGGSFEVTYATRHDGRPTDPIALLEQIVSTYNSRFPFQYRLEQQDDVYSFIPVLGRDASSRQTRVKALLDQRISITKAERSAQATFKLFALALSQQIGERVSCCTALASNFFMQSHFEFEANDEPARDVLLRIIKATGRRFYWLVRNSPGNRWWMINLQSITRETVDPSSGFRYRDGIPWPGARPTTPAPPPPPPPSSTNHPQ